MSICEERARDMHAFSAKPSVVRVSPEKLTCEIPAGRNFHSSPLTGACSVATKMKDKMLIVLKQKTMIENYVY